MTSTWHASWIAGPAAGRTIVLGPGRHLLGRHRQAQVCGRDPALAPFHAELELDADRGVRLTQLAGRAPIGVGGDATQDGDGRWRWDTVRRTLDLELGASRLRLHRVDEPASDAVSSSASGEPPHGAVVRRLPRAVAPWAPVPVRVPDLARAGRPTPAGLVPALAGVAGAGVLALLLHQPMFLVLGSIGALVAVAGWVAQWLAARRGRRTDQHAARNALAAFATALQEQRAARLAHHLASVPSLPAAVATLDRAPAGVWLRRAGHDDAFTVSVGVGDVVWEPVLSEADPTRVPPACWGLVEQAARLRSVPVPARVGPGDRLALCGRDADAVARAVVVQLATQVGPADWQLVIVTDRPERWSWARDLPHLTDGPGGAPRLVGPDDVAGLLREGGLFREAHGSTAPGDGGPIRHTVVVTDTIDTLAVRTHPLRRLLAVEPAPALVAVAPGPLEAPAISTAILDVHVDASGRWTADVARGGLPVAVAVAGLDAIDARWVVGRLAPLRDPEDPRHAGGTVPAEVDLADLLERSGAALDTAGIAARWREHAADRPPATPLGVAADGVVDVDLVRDGPHALLAGTTGSGKSELLRSLVLGLAVANSPEQLTFVLVDYKGGATFDDLRDLPHVVGLVTDLDDHLAARALRSLTAELRHRETVLRELGVADLTAARRSTGRPVLPRLVVVIDEFAALAVELPDFLHALVGIAQRGRSLGVHLVLATQRPHGVISDDIRTNTNLRLALRLPDAADSRDVIDVADAALLPRDRPGRAVLRLGPDELVTFQTARCPQDLRDLVARIAAASAVEGVAAPRRPWLDPLPTLVRALPADVWADSPAPGGPPPIGLIDLPDVPAQRPIGWDPGRGGLLVVGARGSGLTSALRLAAVAALDERTTLLVIDATGDPAWEAVASHPRCAGVVRLADRERLARALAAVGEPGAIERPLLVVDGVAALRAELDTVERSAEHDLLLRALTGRGHPALAIVLGNPDPHALPAAVLARCPTRWLLHVPDGREVDVLGRRVAVPPPGVPGRAVVVESPHVPHAGAELQLVHPAAAPDPARDARAAARLAVLPSRVDVGAIPRPGGDGHPPDEWRALVGLSADDLGPAFVSVPDGEHLLVLGPPRSGRSTALARLLAAWCADRPGAWAGVLAPRRSPLAGTSADAGAVRYTALAELLAALPATGPRLVVVDDAELVDDDGRWAALLASRPVGLVVAAAARPEALRATYGHWTGAVRRGRRGFLAAACHETDGDLLGVVLPRHGPIPARPGLMHVVEDGTLRLVQVAVS